MKNIFVIALLFLFIHCSQPQDTQFSEKALNSKITTVEGDQITLGQLLKTHNGVPVVIDVWAGWCSDCIKGFSVLKETQKKYPDVHYVLISLDRNTEDWKKNIKRYRIQGEHYFATGGWKSTFAKNIDLDWIPRYIFVNSKGEIEVYKAIHADDNLLLEKLDNTKVD